MEPGAGFDGSSRRMHTGNVYRDMTMYIELELPFESQNEHLRFDHTILLGGEGRPIGVIRSQSG